MLETMQIQEVETPSETSEHQGEQDSAVDDEEEEEYEDYTDPCEEEPENQAKRQCTEVRVKELEQANAELKLKLEKANRQIQELRRRSAVETGAAASPSQPPQTSLSPRSTGDRTVVLRQIIRTPNGRNLEDIPMPHRFSDVGSFPHAVDENVKKHTREYQVESRRLTNFVFALFCDEDGSPATEKDIKASGEVMMKMSMLYADDYSEVHPAHFTRAVVNNLVTPSSEINGEKTLKNGEVGYSVRFNVQSTETAPRHRPFVMRVGPSKGDEKYNENLVCYTPPFVVRSKVTAPLSSTKDTLVYVGVSPQAPHEDNEQ